MTGRIAASVALLVGCACLASHCSSADAAEDPPPPKAPAPAAARESPKPSPEVDAWVKEVAAKMTDSNEIIRRSAVHALLAVGPDALPSLGKLAASDDAKVAGTAMDLIAAIKHGGPGGPGGPGGRPRMPGPGMRMGPGAEGPDGPPCPRCDGPGPDGPGPGGPGGMRREGMHHGMRGGPEGPGGPRGRGGPRGPGGMRGAVDGVLDGFALEPATRAKVDEVLKGVHEKARALHEKAMQGGMERDAVHAEFQKLHEDAAKSLEPLLTPEQRKRLDGVLGTRGPRPEQVPGGHGPGAK